MSVPATFKRKGVYSVDVRVCAPVSVVSDVDPPSAVSIAVKLPFMGTSHEFTSSPFAGNVRFLFVVKVVIHGPMRKGRAKRRGENEGNGERLEN